MKNKVNKIILLVIMFVFLITPTLSFAQVPTYNVGNSQIGVGSGGTGQLVGSNATDSGGQLVGTTPNYEYQTINRRSIMCFLKVRPNITDLLDYVTCILSKSVIPLIFGLAMVIFIWGVVQYVIATDDEAKKKKGKAFMIWGIIALAVMVSVWGLVSVVGKTFGIQNVIPQLEDK